MGVVVIGVKLLFPLGESRWVPRATVTAERVTFRREQYRAPYSNVWRTAGDARADPAFFSVSFLVSADGVGSWSMSAAAAEVRGLLADCRRCVSVESHVGRFNNAGVLMHTRSVIDGGFRLDVRLSSNPGRVTISTDGTQLFTSWGDEGFSFLELSTVTFGELS